MSGIRKKRFWSEEEKRSICAQTTPPEVSVAQVAQRYAMNSNLIFKELKEPQFAPREEAAQPEDSAMAFLPVEFGDPSFAALTQSSSGATSSSSAAVSATRVDITLSDGRRILIEGSTALSAVLGLVEGLIT